MTTAGFVSGTREQTVPSTCSRAAAGASLLLGGLLLDSLPGLMHEAYYVAVLAAAAALVSVGAGLVLWTRPTLLSRNVAGLAAGATLAGELLQIVLGLPGVRDLDRQSSVGLGFALAAAGVVLVFLAADALRRKPEPAPDRPYAL
ncbi:MAG TPA: hypothetical protein VFR87_02265 [Nocardioidaceae bacterium]|nr:hypothetical protein [Nocardioidaceae bacterium]